MTTRVEQVTAQPARKKLGRGLDALMGEMRREAPVSALPDENGSAGTTLDRASGDLLQQIDIASISPLPGQPRTNFAEPALEELAASIKSRGVIQPIIVRPLGGDRYQLVAGERRWRAAQKAQLHTIPAIVRTLDQREVLALSLIENLQREDLSPVEEARAYRQLAEREGMTQAEIAAMVDKSRSHVANMQRLLDLPGDVLALLETGALTMGHARAVIGHEAASDIARQAAERRLSVREVEKLVKGRRAAREAKEGQRSANDNADIAAVQGHLEDFLGMPVRIVTEASPQKGAVTIRYRTLDQLDLICQRLTGGDI
ncbi:ParB/RepB/Spo0J family partition protein [Qipengyuania sediminis]|uniref:ParB/RepB/Spo0J family partition protein n=1 Tax=Qipengyuania sediminis TaxID=1532023 RepID=UPI00105A36C7|nr:ParB/RepB/Spo0J family partition protein [Qipengyuania sediminis]